MEYPKLLGEHGGELIVYNLKIQCVLVVQDSRVLISAPSISHELHILFYVECTNFVVLLWTLLTSQAILTVGSDLESNSSDSFLLLVMSYVKDMYSNMISHVGGIFFLDQSHKS